MQPIGCFLRPIGHTCPLSGAKTGAQVAGFCGLMRGNAAPSLWLYRFFDSLKAPEEFRGLVFYWGTFTSAGMGQ